MHWWVNAMTLFESSRAIESSEMKDALRLVIEKYAYLRLRLERDSGDGDWMFVENSPEKIANYEFGWTQADSEHEFNSNWTTRFNQFSSTNPTKQLFGIQVDSFENKYRLYFRISHAG